MRNELLIFFSLLFFFCGAAALETKCSIYAYAAETVMQTPLSPLGEESILPDTPEAEYDEAGTEEEFLAWMSEHKITGGYLRFTRDITLESKYVYNYSRNADPITIDTGSHTLYFADMALFEYAPNLTISGKGGENGVLHTKENAHVELGGMKIMAEEGCAVYQEEGSVLSLPQNDPDSPYNVQVTGLIHFAEKPVLYGYNYDLPDDCIEVEEGSSVMEDVLPTRGAFHLNEGGAVKSVTAGIKWDLTTCEEELSARKRTVVMGTPLGEILEEGAPEAGWIMEEVELLETPSILVVFLKDGAGITTVRAKKDNSGPILTLCYTVPVIPQSPVKAEIYMSPDGEEWTVEEEEEYDDSLSPNNMQFTVFPEGENASNYFQIGVEYPSGRKLYTDVVYVDENQMVLASDIEGNRGGGTDLTPEEPEDSDGGGNLGSGGNLGPPGENERPITPEKNERPKNLLPEADTFLFKWNNFLENAPSQKGLSNTEDMDTHNSGEKEEDPKAVFSEELIQKDSPIAALKNTTAGALMDTEAPESSVDMESEENNTNRKQMVIGVLITLAILLAFVSYTYKKRGR